MSVQIENNPMKVGFKVSQRARLVQPEGAPSVVEAPRCDWKLLVSTIIDQYPDMEISDVVLEQSKLQFRAKFKHRETTEEDLRWRLYNFLRYTPTMKISELEIVKSQAD